MEHDLRSLGSPIQVEDQPVQKHDELCAEREQLGADTCQYLKPLLGVVMGKNRFTLSPQTPTPTAQVRTQHPTQSSTPNLKQNIPVPEHKLLTQKLKFPSLALSLRRIGLTRLVVCRKHTWHRSKLGLTYGVRENVTTNETNVTYEFAVRGPWLQTLIFFCFQKV